MADSSDFKSVPGADAVMNNMSVASKSLQSFASELQRMSKDTMNQTSEMMEKLRGAKTMEDLVAIQTSYVQQSFSQYADYTKRLSELMMTMPMELAKQGRSVFQQGASAMTKATEQAGEQMQKTGEQFTQNRG